MEMNPICHCKASNSTEEQGTGGLCRQLDPSSKQGTDSISAYVPHRVLDVLLILDCPAGGGNRLRKAEAHLQTQAHLRAGLQIAEGVIHITQREAFGTLIVLPCKTFR